MNILGFVGIILMNASLIPQIYRVFKLKDSKAISITNVACTTIALIIFYFQAIQVHNALFIANYFVGVALEVVLLVGVIKYRS